MATQTTGGGSTTSFTNTPQAGDDSYWYTEDWLRNSTYYNTTTKAVTLDVMSNDLGGNAKSLFSIDDGNGNPLEPDYQLLCKDVNAAGCSPWEQTPDGNWIRINNGKIEFKLGNPDAPGDHTQALDLNSLGAGDCVDDEFVYAIRLGNGTLSQATVRIHITGENDEASISVVTGGNDDVTEAGGVANGDAGDNSAGGTLKVTDPDLGEDVFQPVAAGDLEGTYGDFTFDETTGVWTYTLDNGRPDTQGLDDGDTKTETLTVTSLDGTASYDINVTVYGTDDQPTLADPTSGSIAEDDQASTTTDSGLSGTLDGDDVDAGETLTYGISGGAADLSQSGYDVSLAGDYGTLYVNSASGAYLFVPDPAAIEALDEGDSDSDVFTVTVSDGDGPTVDQTYTVNVSGANDTPVSGGIASASGTEDDASIGGNVPAATDVDVEALTYHLVSGSVLVNGSPASDGTVSFNPDGSYSYTPIAADQGLDTGESKVITFDYVANDGSVDSAAATVTITVNGVNDAPVITSNGGGASAGVSVQENTTAVTTVVATDVDVETVTYTIVGGADAAKFDIDPNTGELTFVSAPDYENPTDSGTDNVYDVIVRASDGTDFDDQAIAVTVTDVVEQVVANIKFVPNSNDFNTALPSSEAIGSFVAYDALGNVIPGATFSVTAGSTGTLTVAANGQVSGSLANNNIFNFSITSGAVTETVAVRVGNGSDNVITGGASIDIIFGFNNSDTLSGADNDDALYGNDVADTLNGGAGDDFLIGGNNGDNLNGDDGNDYLRGGVAADTLTGGAGSDIFVLTNAATADTIVDYVAGEIIDITALLTTGGSLTGFVRLTAAGELQIDADGGGNGYITVATLTAGVNATVQYSTGSGTATAVVISGAPPIALDLDGDGQVSFLGAYDGAEFDYGGGTVATAWVAGNDGMLVRDANHDGKISADEIVFATTGSDLEGLARYDSNGDGKLSADDAGFGDFGVWQDADSDGEVDAGELQSLATHSIDSVSLSSDGQSYTAANGDVTVVGTGSFTRTDGSTGVLADAVFNTGGRVTDEARAQVALGNGTILLGAVAAAGLAAMPVAAHDVNFDSSDGQMGLPAFRGSGLHATVSESADVVGLAGPLSSDLDLGPIIGHQGSVDFVAIAANHSLIGSERVETLDLADYLAPAELPSFQAPDVQTALAPALVAIPSAEQLLAAFDGRAGGATEQLVSDVITEALAGNAADADVNALLDAALSSQAPELAAMGDGLFQSHAGPANLSLDAFGPLGMSGAHQMMIMEMMAVQPDAVSQG